MNRFFRNNRDEVFIFACAVFLGLAWVLRPTAFGTWRRIGVLALMTCCAVMLAAKLWSRQTGREKTSKQDTDEWLSQAIAFFRNLGFFASRGTTADDKFKADFLESYHAEWGEDFDASREHAELRFLAYDKDRVWWDDTEADVGRGNNTYVRVLREWSVISRGAFKPTEVVETWSATDGPIQVSFYHDDQRVTCHPQYLEDYLDLAILKEINSVIQKTGIQFCVHEPFDQTAFIVVLNASEKRLLQTDRKLAIRSIE